MQHPNNEEDNLSRATSHHVRTPGDGITENGDTVRPEIPQVEEVLTPGTRSTQQQAMNTPDPDAVLRRQYEGMLFQAGAQSSTARNTRVEFDDSSPLYHQARRSSELHNDLVRNANRQSSMFLRNFSTPNVGYTSMYSEPNVVSGDAREQVPVYYMHAGAAGGNPGDDGDDSDNGSDAPDNGNPSNQGGGPPNGNNQGGGPPNVPPNNAGGGGGGNGPTCTICGSTNHLDANCPQRNTGGGQPNPTCAHCGGAHATANCPTYHIANVNGHQLKVRKVAVKPSSFIRQSIWDKRLRSTLSSEDRIAFEKAATGYVLAKTNKLCQTQQIADDKEALQKLMSTHDQLRSLKAHADYHDIGDVFTVVFPVNLNTSFDLKKKTMDIWTDYPILTPTMVAVSTAYYNMWVAEHYISENLNLTYTFIQNNTDPTLFGKCLEEYEKYSPISQGGPLMLILILQRISVLNTQHKTNLWNRVKALKIRNIVGEDVDTVVSLLNAAHQAFRATSTNVDRDDAVPQDWYEVIIKVLQSSSVSKFNDTFEQEEDRVWRDSAIHGCNPVWLPHDQLMLMATNQYHRLKHSGQWDAPNSTKRKGYNYTANTKLKCFNCGKDDHTVPQCKVPLDEAKVKKARDKFLADKKKKKSEKKPGTTPATTSSAFTTTSGITEVTIDKVKYKVNKEGVFVCCDPEKLKERAEKGQRTIAKKAAASSTPATPATTPAPRVTMAATPPAPILPPPTAPPMPDTAAYPSVVPARGTQQYFRRLV